MDDDEAIRRLIVTALRMDGYDMSEAENGREALTAMRTGHEDLVLLDLMMPEVSGWDVLRERADCADLRRIPVIVISAIARDGGAFPNVCATLPKPFEIASLRATVRSCLSKR